jgi:hypothetical protein
MTGASAFGEGRDANAYRSVEIIEAADGETIVSVQRTRGCTRHMQVKANVQWAAVFTIRDGKVLRAHGYMSQAEALEAAALRSTEPSQVAPRNTLECAKSPAPRSFSNER